MTEILQIHKLMRETDPRKQTGLGYRLYKEWTTQKREKSEAKIFGAPPSDKLFVLVINLASFWNMGHT